MRPEPKSKSSPKTQTRRTKNGERKTFYSSLFNSSSSSMLAPTTARQQLNTLPSFCCCLTAAQSKVLAPNSLNSRWPATMSSDGHHSSWQSKHRFQRRIQSANTSITPATLDERDPVIRNRNVAQLFPPSLLFYKATLHDLVSD